MDLNALADRLEAISVGYAAREGIARDGHVMLLARRTGVDLDAALDRKWLRRERMP